MSELLKGGRGYLNKGEEDFENLFLYKHGRLRLIGKQLDRNVPKTGQKTWHRNIQRLSLVRLLISGTYYGHAQ